MPSPREIVLRQLQRVEDEGAFVARLAPNANDLRDARFVTDLVAGVTRQRRWLDFLIDQFYCGKEESLDPVLRQVLRMGLYELLIRDTAPHAAVNEAVSLAKRATHRGGAALVNAILRNIERSRAELPEPESEDEAERLAIRFSHPTWLVSRWLEAFGRQGTDSLLRHNNEPPRPCLRVNTRRYFLEDVRVKLKKMEVDVEETVLDDFLRVSRLQSILAAGWLEEGRVAVQDVAAGCVVRVLDPQPGERILDAAAAPGGKALYTALRMKDEGEIVAVDVHPGKTELIQEAADAHRLRSVRPLCADLRDVSFDHAFDRVLLDAPCTGTGVLSKRADLRWRLTEQRLEELTTLQGELLEAASLHVRPGGLLVYATCSIEEEENQRQAASFLARHPDFARESVAAFSVDDFLTPEGEFQALPHVHGTDGAYAVRLRRNS